MKKLVPPDPNVPWAVDAAAAVEELRGRKSRTAQELGINVEAARRGLWDNVLPRGQRPNWRVYPLPTDKGDLYKLALYAPGGRGGGSGGIGYLKRCKKAYELWSKHRATLDLGSRLIEGESQLKQLKGKRAEAERVLEDLKQEVAVEKERAKATLMELYDLAGSGAKLIMESFVKEGLEGTVSISDFNQTMGKVFGQVAKLGTPSTDEAKKEAREIVWEKALEETREKLRLQEGAPAVRLEGPKGEQ